MCVAMKLKTGMKKTVLLLGFVAVLPLATVQAQEGEAQTETQESRPQATIHHVNLGGIRDWRALDSRSLRVVSSRNQVYLVELSHTCHGLRFANTIAFIPEANGSLTRFSSIYARGERCWIRSIVDISDEEEEAVQDDAANAADDDSPVI